MEYLEYAFYTENFEIYQFRFKTYGAGKWAKTYDEAHELAKEAVLKKCMEENPHLAFQNKIQEQDKPVMVYNGQRTISNNPVTLEGILRKNNDTENLSALGYEPSEKINKGTIEEQIEAFEGTLDQLIKEWNYVAAMNPKYKKVFDKKFKELESKKQQA